MFFGRRLCLATLVLGLLGGVRVSYGVYTQRKGKEVHDQTNNVTGIVLRGMFLILDIMAK